MLHSEAKELGACGMGFDMVEGAEARDQVVEIDSVVILHWSSRRPGSRRLPHDGKGKGWRFRGNQKKTTK